MGVFTEACTQRIGSLVISRVKVLSTSSGTVQDEQLSLSHHVSSLLAAEHTHWWECCFFSARHQCRMLTDSELRGIQDPFHFIWQVKVCSLSTLMPLERSWSHMNGRGGQVEGTAGLSIKCQNTSAT